MLKSNVICHSKLDTKKVFFYKTGPCPSEMKGKIAT